LLKGCFTKVIQIRVKTDRTVRIPCVRISRRTILTLKIVGYFIFTLATTVSCRVITVIALVTGVLVGADHAVQIAVLALLVGGVAPSSTGSAHFSIAILAFEAAL
jgi:hypothetical protein